MATAFRIKLFVDLCMGKAFMAWVLLWCSVFTYSYAQEISSKNKRAQSAYNHAASHLRNNHLEQAAKSLEEAVSHDPNFAGAYQQLGDVYRSLAKYPKAISSYQKVLELKPELTPLTLFGLGESYLFSGDYDNAIHYLNSYQAKANLSEKSKSLVEKHLNDARFASQHLANKVTNIQSVSDTINTHHDEYFPQLTADNQTIIFTRKTDNQENFYESTLHEGEWVGVKKLEGEINSEQFNEGAHCISPDGKYLFFTGCNRPNGLGSCDIYVSKKENGHWSEPQNLGSPINTRGWEAQPSISADGKTLYFVSNRQGGQGGYDIWKSTLKDDGSWNDPTNLGPSINTPYDEGAPYIHADNQTLFFSSNGWPGFGKKDIFRSRMDAQGNWATPENLGHPINDHHDQLSMHVSMDGQTAHIASQNNGQHLDIYTFEIPIDVRPHPIAFIEGTVLSAKTNEPLDAKISVTNTNTNQVVFEDYSDYLDGQFLATLPIGSHYAVHVQREGYLFDSKPYDLDSLGLNNQKFEDVILLQPIETGSTTILNNIYFDVNKSELLPQSRSDLDLLVNFMKINPSVRIALSGHTDSTGNKDKNQILSENRVKAVVDYLKSHGVAVNRLKAIGHGDSQPIADNETDEGRQMNRRTEVKVLER